MAEETAQEKTEEPSSRRLSEARERGQVARSKDLNATVIMLFTLMGFLIFGNQLARHMAEMMHQAFEFDHHLLLTPEITFERLFFLVKYGLWALVPILSVILALSFMAPLIMGGWVFSTQSLAPKLSKLNPIKGFNRIFSVKGLVEMIKAFLKFLLVAVATMLVLKFQLPLLFSLGDAPIDVAIMKGSYILIKSAALIAASLIVVVLIDVPFQLYEHKKSLKMTKQELRDEYKQTEGSPEVKAAVRRAQREMVRRRMMLEVPKADVVLTNPTHYAVAISYQKQGKKAPIVIAKGKDLIAFQISNLAKKNEVPIISIPPLARAIYFSTQLNKEIPRGLYVAVAQVLAYIYQLRDKKRYDYKPQILQNVPIPPELARKEKA